MDLLEASSVWDAGVYEDAGISGAKSRDKQPGFDRLLKDATACKANMIAAWSVDRPGQEGLSKKGLNSSRRGAYK
jgi:DNA invertase Pin-like site-specific DNA recombinase